MDCSWEEGVAGRPESMMLDGSRDTRSLTGQKAVGNETRPTLIPSTAGAELLESQRVMYPVHRAPPSHNKGGMDVLHPIIWTSSPGCWHSPKVYAPAAAATGENIPCNRKQIPDCIRYSVQRTETCIIHLPSEGNFVPLLLLFDPIAVT